MFKKNATINPKYFVFLTLAFGISTYLPRYLFGIMKLERSCVLFDSSRMNDLYFSLIWQKLKTGINDLYFFLIKSTLLADDAVAANMGTQAS